MVTEENRSERCCVRASAMLAEMKRCVVTLREMVSDVGTRYILGIFSARFLTHFFSFFFV